MMFTPSLVCAMNFCPMQSSTQVNEHKPCHQSENRKKQGLMLVVDCMGVDLFQSDVLSDVPQPDQSVNIIHIVWADLTAEYSFLPYNTIHGIRGPPEWAGRPQRQPSIILTTQRFRI